MKTRSVLSALVVAVALLGGVSQARPTATGTCGVASTFIVPTPTINVTPQHQVLFGGSTECTAIIGHLSVSLVYTDLITGDTYALDSCIGDTKAGAVAICDKFSPPEADLGLWSTTSVTTWTDSNGTHSLAGLPFVMVA